MKRLTTLTGPSCAGKSTLERALVGRGALQAVSTTTRPPRAGEVDGQHYYFVDREKFQALWQRGAFIEVVEFGGNYYGIAAAELERLWAQGEHVVLVVEPNGARQIDVWARQNRDVTLRKVFVDGEAQTISQRFLARFEADLAGATTPEQRAKLVETYARRMEMMLTTERYWSSEARDLRNTLSGFRYDVLLPYYDASNEARVLAELA